MGSSTDYFVCMRSNNNVVAVMDQNVAQTRNVVHLFSIKGNSHIFTFNFPISHPHHFPDLLATDSVPLVTPYHRLELPFDECQHVFPCLALTATSLLVARKGTNTLLRMSVWKENNNDQL